LTLYLRWRIWARSLETDYNELTRRAADQNARREAAEREAGQAQNRLNRVRDDHDRAAAKLSDLLLGGTDMSSQNLFAAASKDALSALEAARTHEQKLSAARSDAEKADRCPQAPRRSPILSAPLLSSPRACRKLGWPKIRI